MAFVRYKALHALQGEAGGELAFMVVVIHGVTCRDNSHTNRVLKWPWKLLSLLSKASWPSKLRLERGRWVYDLE